MPYSLQIPFVFNPPPRGSKNSYCSLVRSYYSQGRQGRKVYKIKLAIQNNVTRGEGGPKQIRPKFYIFSYAPPLSPVLFHVQIGIIMLVKTKKYAPLEQIHRENFLPYVLFHQKSVCTIRQENALATTACSNNFLHKPPPTHKQQHRSQLRFDCKKNSIHPVSLETNKRRAMVVNAWFSRSNSTCTFHFSVVICAHDLRP